MNILSLLMGQKGSGPVGDIPSWLVGRTLAGGGSGEWRTIENVAVADFVAAKARPLRDLIIDIKPVQSGSGNPSPSNVRPIAGWSEAKVWVEPTYDTTASPQVTIDLDGTRYSGTLDVNTGLLTVTMVSETLTEAKFVSTSASSVLWGIRRVADPPAFDSKNGNVLCNLFKPKSTFNPGELWWTSTSSYISVLPLDQTLNTKELADSWIAEHPIQLVFTLANPQIVQLSPTEVTALLGQNYLWADTGNIVKLTYFGEATP